MIAIATTLDESNGFITLRLENDEEIKILPTNPDYDLYLYFYENGNYFDFDIKKSEISINPVTESDIHEYEQIRADLNGD